MKKQDLKLRSPEGKAYDCYLVTPDVTGKVPAIVLASAIHGVDEDLRNLVDAFAAKGYIAAAPDLFWRTVPGPLGRDDPRSKPRGMPRLEVIKSGEQDMVDTLNMIKTLPQFNGKAAAIGFCYGGPYAILGPKRLGYAAGISCHGTQMMDYLPEMDGVTQPVCILWGDQDTMAPAPVLDAYRAAAAKRKNLALHVFPGVLHGYMMRGSPTAYDQKAYDISMAETLKILEGLR